MEDWPAAVVEDGGVVVWVGGGVGQQWLWDAHLQQKYDERGRERKIGSDGGRKGGR